MDHPFLIRERDSGVALRCGEDIDDLADRIGVRPTTLAATLSRALPLVFERLGRDPSLVPGPLLSSLLDVLGVVNYFLIARWFLAA